MLRLVSRQCRLGGFSFWWWYSIYAIILVWSVELRAAPEEPWTIDKVTEEVRQSHARLRQALNRTSLRWSYTVQKFEPAKSRSEFTRSICLCMEERLWKRMSKKSDSQFESHGVILVNPEYRAEIEGARGRYHLLNLALNESHDSNGFLDSIPGELHAPCASLHAVAGWTVLDLLEGRIPFLTVRGVEAVAGEEPLVRIEAPYRERADDVMEFFLSPSNDWAVKRIHDQSSELKFKTVTEIQYQPWQGSYVPLKVVSTDRWIESGKVIQRIDYAFEPPQACECNPEEFYLTAYGLPEPGRDWGRLIFNIGLLVLGILLVAFTVRKLRRGK